MPHDPLGLSGDDFLTAAEPPRDSRSEFVRQFLQHERAIRAYILSLVPSWADAEDLFQEVSIRIFEQLDDWDQSRDFLPWACTIAYYQVLTWRKRAGRHRSRFSEAALELLADPHLPNLEQGERRQALLLLCLEKLDTRSRSLVQMVYGGDFNIHQVAQQLERNVMAVYKLLSRIRLMLRDCVEQKLQEADSTGEPRHV